MVYNFLYQYIKCINNNSIKDTYKNDTSKQNTTNYSDISDIDEYIKFHIPWII